MSAPLIAVADLEKTYATRAPHSVQALAGITLDITAGEFVTIVGQSGCGKTTLLKILAGLLPCSGGRVTLRGTVVDAGKLELMRSLRATRWQTFRLVQFPNALPFVFAGLDIAIVFSVLGAIVGEFVGAQRGLGNLTLQFNMTLDIAGVFAVLIMLSLMGVALHLVMQAIQRRIIFWAEPDDVISA